MIENKAKYNHQEIEKKWQEKWEQEKTHLNKNIGKNSQKRESKNEKEKFYVLDQFTYPSGDGLHMGHTESYTATDVVYRFKRMQGFDVLHPQGFDAFGLPAENFAIKTGTHPKETTAKNTANFLRQMKSLGLGHDFSRIEEGTTTNPEYYKWTQWIFGKFFENDIAYKKTAKANWCDSCNTVIANEQVESGKCERCGTEIEQKDIPSWMLRITDFADDLIWNEENEKKNGLMDWPSHTKKNQNAWIGKSEGAHIEFPLVESEYIDINRDGGKDTYQDGVEEVERFNIVAIIESPNGEEFLCAKWKKVDWQGFVTGGIEKGDTVEETAIKEVQEETGYQKPEIVKVYNKSSHGKFYHVGKKVNRFAHYQIVHVKLKDLEKIERSEEEKDIADMVWVKKDEVNDFLKRGDMKYPWRVVNGKDILDQKIKVFTTRPDTLFGATYAVLAPEHELVGNLEEQITNFSEVSEYIKKTSQKTELERLEGKEKTGVELQGVSAVNPANGELMPVFISDYVLAGYGTGSVMGVPGHCIRDFEFTKVFNLPVKRVVVNEDGDISKIINIEQVQEKGGVLTNSNFLDGMSTHNATQEIMNYMEKEGWGERTASYRIRDWSISRQRYWGTPIPMVYSPEGKAHFVGEENLPWLLPTDVDFVPTGIAPLAKSKELVERTERIFGKGWTPEVDTMDTFVDSSWYFLRYADPHNANEFASPEAMKKWLPVDLYIGGVEHTYMHLLFARFFIKAMHKIGLVGFNEPFLKKRHQGMVNDIHGKKMSKSKGNVVNPDEMVDRFGADATRTYMLFSSPLEDDVIWNEDNIVGIYRFLEKVWRQKEKISDTENVEAKKELHKTIKSVTEKMEDLKFNVAISDMMKCINFFDKQDSLNKEDYLDFVKMLSPFAPHICDEIAEGVLIEKKWPEFDPEFAKEESVTIGIQINGKRRAEVEISQDAEEDEVREKVLAMDEVQKWTEGKELKKFIYVRGRIISLIV